MPSTSKHFNLKITCYICKKLANRIYWYEKTVCNSLLFVHINLEQSFGSWILIRCISIFKNTWIFSLSYLLTFDFYRYEHDSVSSRKITVWKIDLAKTIYSLRIQTITFWQFTWIDFCKYIKMNCLLFWSLCLNKYC